jgi:hypothetical protein
MKTRYCLVVWNENEVGVSKVFPATSLEECQKQQDEIAKTFNEYNTKKQDIINFVQQNFEYKYNPKNENLTNCTGMSWDAIDYLKFKLSEFNPLPINPSMTDTLKIEINEDTYLQ